MPSELAQAPVSVEDENAELRRRIRELEEVAAGGPSHDRRVVAVSWASVALLVHLAIARRRAFVVWLTAVGVAATIRTP